MKFSLKSLKKVTSLEIIVILLLITYIVLPIDTPDMLSPYLSSTLSMVLLLILVVYLFLHAHPVIAVLSIFASYELLRRSSKIIEEKAESIASMTIFNKDPLPIRKTEEKDNAQVVQPSPVYDTLEEDVVSQRAPIGVINEETIVSSSYSPIGDNSHRIQ